ncbi:hypothetical protein APR04_002977 [Promicromonospora umidemergens]|uniref:Uncharacterized protein n=1 Tax=Promicromonospora umidemergens TaxID=629679 RepID=A0ABP8WFX5_9MICO|nr:hypothetical protein [Promicromonospora umidemergens]MCP2284057.1 hypothetical protein [Promicromonospora umidemergens]
MAFRVAYESGDLGNSGHSFDLTYDYESLVMELCQVLAKTEGARFILSGFGREPWPMSVDYDMSVFLEQLPDLLENLESGDLFGLDMYSQGTETELEFSPDGDELTIRCSSRTAWVPDPATERLGHGPLLQMLRKLAADFALGARTVDPALAAIEPFEQWLTWADTGAERKH